MKLLWMFEDQYARPKRSCQEGNQGHKNQVQHVHPHLLYLIFVPW